MNLDELREHLAQRAQDAETVQATAPVALIYRAVLKDLARAADGTDQTTPATVTTWRERLWTCPPETRLGVCEVAEALGRPKSWVYRAVSAKRGPCRLPCRRLDGELVFEAGTVRTWIARTEESA